MKILVVSSFLPYPLDSGGHVRLYNLVKELSQKHEIALICEKRKYQTEEDIEKLKKFCKKVVVVDRKKQWSIKNVLKTGFSLYPFLLIGHKNQEMNRVITDELKEKSFDVIHIETFYVMQNLPQVSIPTVLVEHNIEYLVYERYSNTLPVLLKLFLMVDIVKLKYWENYFWSRATKLVAVSNVEKKLMNRNDVMVVPNGVDLQKFQYKPKKPAREKRVLFLGNFKWVQNRDSIRWILNEVWPLISQNKDIILWIVGSNIPDDIKKIDSDRIVIEENSPLATEEILQNADVMISPIRVGGGTSYKILESMAVGLPVVTTSLGAEGIGEKNLKEVVVADDPNAFAQGILKVLGSDVLRNKNIKNARKVVEETYDWKMIVKKLEDVYKSAVT